ncbi:MAG: copper uptake system-associated protein [Phyllobacteriaceae bacterium]|nr:copper uptake system-associated protein [Phyllobacteriaceae bacterium]
MMKRILLAVFFSLSMGLVALEQAFANEAAHHIMHVLKAQFDTPENPLTVEPVSIEGDFAVAGWSQGGKGGRALLKSVDGQWVIWLCSGAGLKQAQLMHEAGMDMAAAEKLAAMVVADEAKLDPAKVALFDGFEGTLMIGAEGHAGHGTHGTHGTHGAAATETQTQ